MSMTIPTTQSPTTNRSTSQLPSRAHGRIRSRTRAAAAVAAPLFFGAGLVQAAFRDGFDLRRHMLSHLMNGDYGWIQVLNFLICGALFVAAAFGMRSAYRTSLRGTTALLAVFGATLIAAALFRADPAYRFPPGTPVGAPDSVTWHGAVHLLVGATGFLCLVAACFTAARYLARHGEPRWARWSRRIGVAFLVGFVALGANTAVTNIVFVVTAAGAFGWASSIAALRPAPPAPDAR
jgi:Protein of unknown function (DUF998)